VSILVTVFGTASRNEATDLVGKVLASASPAVRAQFQRTGQLPRQISAQILAHGIATAFQFAVLFALLALVISLVVIQARPTGPPRDAGTPVPSETAT